MKFQLTVVKDCGLAYAWTGQGVRLTCVNVVGLTLGPNRITNQ